VYPHETYRASYKHTWHAWSVKAFLARPLDMNVKAWLHPGERPEEAAGDVPGLAEEALSSARL